MKVGIIFGANSSEHEVSLLSAASVMRAIGREKYELVNIGISKDGSWKLYEGGPELLERCGSVGSPDYGSELWTAEAADIEIGQLKKLIDFAFIVVHGAYGEDGRLQGLFETLEIPYSGSGVLASSLCMDKEMSKRIYEAWGFPTPEYRVLRKVEGSPDGEQMEQALLAAEELSYPVFVKPANTGSSVGISLVKGEEGLAAAIREAARYDSKILIERAILKARELEIGIMGNGMLSSSVVGEIIPGNEFYDYAAKYSSEGGSRLIIPAELDEPALDRLWEIAVYAYTVCGCKGFARVDFLQDPENGDIFLNEINTIPGFTEYSMIPLLFKESGVSYGKLIDRIIELGMEEHGGARRSSARKC